MLQSLSIRSLQIPEVPPEAPRQEKLQIVSIQNHLERIIFTNLPYGCTLWHSVLFIRIILSAVFIVNVCRSLNLFL